MSKISAAIITFNEEKNIERCIDSLKNVVDEIVIIDSGSTDQTVEIATRLKAIVILNPFEGHIQQKNFAITRTQFDWVISLDADEALSEELRASILAVKENLKGGGYIFSRLTNYCGKWIKHCGWYPDIKVRLFNKSITSWEGVVHEKLVYTKSISTELIIGDLNHYSYYTEQEHLDRLKKYAQLSAEEKFKAKKGNENYKIIFSPIFKFISVFMILTIFNTFLCFNFS